MPRRIALFGQAAFAKDVLVRLLDAGHTIVGVFAPPSQRPDPLVEEAEKHGIRTVRHKAFRRHGEAIPERVAEYAGEVIDPDSPVHGQEKKLQQNRLKRERR